MTHIAHVAMLLMAIWVTLKSVAHVAHVAMQHCAVQHAAEGRDAAQLCCGAAKSRERLVGGFGFEAPG